MIEEKAIRIDKAQRREYACIKEGCDKGMFCFGGGPTGLNLCVEAIRRYNALIRGEEGEKWKE